MNKQLMGKQQREEKEEGARNTSALSSSLAGDPSSVFSSLHYTKEKCSTTFSPSSSEPSIAVMYPSLACSLLPLFTCGEAVRS